MKTRCHLHLKQGSTEVRCPSRAVATLTKDGAKYRLCRKCYKVVQSALDPSLETLLSLSPRLEALRSGACL